MVAFLPIPGFSGSPPVPKMVLAVTLAACIWSSQPAVPAVKTMDQILIPMAGELAWGASLGLLVALLLEVLPLAGQLIGVQAGYAYATLVDPNSQADSPVLQVFLQLVSGLLFVSLGLDREFVRAAAGGFSRFTLDAASVEGIWRLSGGMIAAGLRLAFPVLALLLLLDLSLALFGKLQAQLQMLTLSFPLKMLAALLMLAATAGTLPFLFRQVAAACLARVH